jgi:hypothetical protein
VKTAPEKLAYDREWRKANRDWQKSYDKRLTPEQKAAHQQAKKERFEKFRREFVGPLFPGRACGKRTGRYRGRGRPETVKMHRKRRKLAEAKRTPWFGEFDRLVASEAQGLLPLREVATGVKWEIDHMFPLRGKTVSGLHVGNNLAVIPAAVNNWKGAKVVLTETGDWLRHVA